MEYSREVLFPHREIREILDLYRTIWALDHASSLMGWDLETNMPEEGVLERGVAVSEISALRQKLVTEERFLKAVERAEAIEDLNDYERGVIRVLKREIRYYTRVPPEIVKELSRITSEASVIWRNAKSEGRFDKFKPYLEKIVDLEIKIADSLSYDEHPYDALLDIYEEGLRTREFQSIIGSLIPSLKKILEKIISEEYYTKPHPLETERYDTDAMRRVNQRILEILGFNPKRMRLDVSAHPFTSGISLRDVRITVRYEGYDFKRALYSLIHEFGHALYDLQIDERYAMTPLAGGASLGVHESQSRFWENIIGRSRGFVEAVYDILAEELKLGGRYDPEDLYRYFNIVRPSLIRVDADEVTYNFHIALRFELERMMISREIKIGDLPEIWNDYMERYLGIKPKNDSEGVLQDIHWSMGSIGYFPTYSIGTILAAQIRKVMEKDLNLEEIIRSRNLDPVRRWLRDRIHVYGAMYPPKELIRRSLGEDLNPSVFIEYLERKYLG
ncbi:MAG: carboxypeptidase M32 [Sulfolobales archaeon]